MRLPVLGDMTDLRRRLAARLLTLSRLLVLLPATLWLHDGPARAAVASDSTDDLILTVLARKTLLDDRDLATLNLGVRVHRRVATLWGPVPSAATAHRAIAMLTNLPELVRVQNDMHVADDSVPFATPMAIAPPHAGSPQSSAPQSSTPLPAALTGRTPEPASASATSTAQSPAIAEGAWQSARPAQDPRMPDHREFEMVLPSLRVPTPPLSDPASAALDRTIQKSVGDLQGNQRFQAIHVQVKDALVTLAGAPSPALYDFAHAVSHLPGVRRVIVTERR